MRNESGTCPICGAANPEIFLEVPGVPVHCNRLWANRGEAIQAPRGDLRLAFCRACTHIYNLDFRPERMAYGGEYENSLHFSPHFQEDSTSLAGYLVERFGLRGRRVLEIGCGKGEFLAQLVLLGNNLGLGFDPAYEPGRIPAAAAARMQVARELFSPEKTPMEADFICCRHVLEHLADPVGFLAALRPAEGRQPVPLFFEVPNVLFILRDAGIWDLIYEHPSYFGPGSVRHAFAAAGCEVLAVQEGFGGQFLRVEAIAADMPPSAPAGSRMDAEIGALVDRFRQRFPAQLADWREGISALRRLGRRAVIWGAGSKGVTFLNLLPAGEEIIGAIDVNPHKQGKFLPGTGQPVLPPEALPAHAPDLVIVMNPAYRREIEQHLEKLGLFPEVRVV